MGNVESVSLAPLLDLETYSEELEEALNRVKAAVITSIEKNFREEKPLKVLEQEIQQDINEAFELEPLVLQVELAIPWWETNLSNGSSVYTVSLDSDEKKITFILVHTGLIKNKTISFVINLYVQELL